MAIKLKTNLLGQGKLKINGKYQKRLVKQITEALIDN